MLTPKEKKTIEKLLRLAPTPDEAFDYDELCGFLFGIAMTPDLIAPSEWLPIVFGGDLPQFKAGKEFEDMIECLTTVFNKMVIRFQENRLVFPFDLEKVSNDQLEAMFGWVSGFEEALSLREELWDPEEYPKLSKRKKEQLMHSIMTIQGLVDPTDMLEMFENMPDDLFQETFPDAQGEFADREVQIQVLLLATLPLSINTLLDHARSIDKNRRKNMGGKTIPIPIRPKQSSDSVPCSCPGGACGPPSQIPPKKQAKIIKVNFPQHGKKNIASTTPIFQLKISLQGIKPAIWRRIQVPGDTTLDRLHKVIQLCMGWTDSHLHQFLIDRTCYSLPDTEDFRRTGRPQNEAKFTLLDLQDKIAKGFQYIYDYGDDWLHQMSVEKILEAAAGKPYPQLLTGKRACPPEDIGGIPGFMQLLEVLRDPAGESYKDLIEWLDEEYDPARFGKEEIALINAVLEEMYS
jgi:yecA family protein